MSTAPHRPSLLVGPLLRYVDEHAATVFVEVDRPGTVEVLGRGTRTFTVFGHHYAIVVIDGLAAGTDHPYTVDLDGTQVWPGPDDHDLPPSLIRTHPEAGRRWEVVFGSCRRIQDTDDDPHPDALRVYAERLLADPDRERPDLLLMLGDQVYSCRPSLATMDLLRKDRPGPTTERTGPGAPPEEVHDFGEYTWLYRESWTRQRSVRWLLSTVPSAMIFDDHDIIDDWNISESWVADMRQQDWWHDRVVGGLMAYWLYQHLGNLSPADLAADETLQALTSHDGDAGALFEERATAWDRGAEPTPLARWSFLRRLGTSRLVVVDSRNGRRLGEGDRDMLDEGEWRWLEEQVEADADHLLIASSVPFLMARGNHDVEVWNELLCSGRWGPRVAGWAEGLRRGIDLEHWAAFQRGFHHMARLVAEKADGRAGEVPSSVLLLSGDVHCAYTAPADTGPDQQAPVWQLTCSPMHYLVEPRIRAAFKASMSIAGRAMGRVLRATTRSPSPELDWDLVDGPEFGSFLATVHLDGAHAEVRFERADRGGFTTWIHRQLTGVDLPAQVS